MPPSAAPSGACTITITIVVNMISMFDRVRNTTNADLLPSVGSACASNVSRGIGSEPPSRLPSPA